MDLPLPTTSADPLSFESTDNLPELRPALSDHFHYGPIERSLSYEAPHDETLVAPQTGEENGDYTGKAENKLYTYLTALAAGALQNPGGNKELLMAVSIFAPQKENVVLHELFKRVKRIQDNEAALRGVIDMFDKVERDFAKPTTAKRVKCPAELGRFGGAYKNRKDPFFKRLAEFYLSLTEDPAFLGTLGEVPERIRASLHPGGEVRSFLEEIFPSVSRTADGKLVVESPPQKLFTDRLKEGAVKRFYQWFVQRYLAEVEKEIGDKGAKIVKPPVKLMKDWLTEQLRMLEVAAATIATSN